MANSPPWMKTIPALGLVLKAPARFALRAMLIALLRSRTGLRRGEDGLPIVLHVNHGPAFGSRLVERLVELADIGVPVIGVFAHRVGMMHEPHEAEVLADSSPFQHLLVAVGIAEGEDRLAPDEMVDAFGLPRPVVDEQDLGLLHQDRARIPHLILSDAG